MQKIRMFVILWTLSIISLMVTAQSVDGGVHFVQGLSWEQIVTKAKAENKFIFVDCYATWCGPCKKMDKNIYPNDTIGNFMNEKFVSVKIQMDSAKGDNELIKLTYPIAREFETKYNVEALPTFIFFDPNGNAVHKEIGEHTVKKFLSLVNDALDTTKQIYRFYKNWEKGLLSYQEMPNVAKILWQQKEQKLALQIARDYMKNYLEKLSEDKFVAMENITFLEAFNEMLTSDDRVFQYYYYKPSVIDSVVNFKGYSNDFVIYILSKELVKPHMDLAKLNGQTPSWNKIESSIKEKYKKAAARSVIITSKVDWYKGKKDWENYIKYLVQEVNLKGGNTMSPGFGTSMYLNNAAWDVFLYSTNKKFMKKAVKWMDYVINISEERFLPGNLDTKASLLYKLGKKEEAIKLEEKAYELSKDPGFKKIIENMKEGRNIWDQL